MRAKGSSRFQTLGVQGLKGSVGLICDFFELGLNSGHGLHMAVIQEPEELQISV